jgi:hypothetical protein
MTTARRTCSCRLDDRRTRDPAGESHAGRRGRAIPANEAEAVGPIIDQDVVRVNHRDTVGTVVFA